MSTIIYPSPIFGPVHSRRLGISIGINLMPADGKVCSFNCIYCECGLNEAHRPTLPRPTREEVAQKLEEKLQQMAAEGITPLVGFCYLLFVLLYFPCLATIVAIKHETGSWRWAAFAATYTTVLAWIVSFVVYQVGSMFC